MDISRNSVSHEARSDISAAASGLLARTAFLASIGELQTDKSSVLNKLSQSGPHGRQLLEELDRFKSSGGELDRISLGNWTKNGYKLKELFSGAGVLGSMDHTRILYRSILADSVRDVLTHTGPVGPRTGCAFTLAHEIGHLDGTERELFAKGADPKQIARKNIERETSAIISSLKWQQELGSPIQDSSFLRHQLKNNQLGDAIKRYWTCPELKSMSTTEANTIANEYLKRTFGGSIDSQGRIANYSLEHVRQMNLGARSNEISRVARSSLSQGGALLVPAAEANRLSSLAVSSVSESGSIAARLPGRVAQTIGTLGLLCLVNDISSGFKKSPQEGAHQIAKVGVNWIGWEAGVATMLKFTGRRTPLACLAAGVIGSVGAEKIFDAVYKGHIQR